MLDYARKKVLRTRLIFVGDVSFLKLREARSSETGRRSL